MLMFNTLLNNVRQVVSVNDSVSFCKYNTVRDTYYLKSFSHFLQPLKVAFEELNYWSLVKLALGLVDTWHNWYLKVAV